MERRDLCGNIWWLPSFTQLWKQRSISKTCSGAASNCHLVCHVGREEYARGHQTIETGVADAAIVE